MSGWPSSTRSPGGSAPSTRRVWSRPSSSPARIGACDSRRAREPRPRPGGIGLSQASASSGSPPASRKATAAGWVGSATWKSSGRSEHRQPERQVQRQAEAVEARTQVGRRRRCRDDHGLRLRPDDRPLTQPFCSSTIAWSTTPRRTEPGRRTCSVAAGDVLDLGLAGRDPRHHRAQLATDLLDLVGLAGLAQRVEVGAARPRPRRRTRRRTRRTGSRRGSSSSRP